VDKSVGDNGVYYLESQSVAPVTQREAQSEFHLHERSSNESSIVDRRIHDGELESFDGLDQLKENDKIKSLFEGLTVRRRQDTQENDIVHVIISNDSEKSLSLCRVKGSDDHYSIHACMLMTNKCCFNFDLIGTYLHCRMIEQSPRIPGARMADEIESRFALPSWSVVTKTVRCGAQLLVG
jgi:hypothetical protein